MDHIFFLILRRMRLPLIMLVLTYATTMLGLVLIPGQDPQGNPWHMDFFHAFYFVSFMATTIGFGEIPYEFTNAQRLWVTFSIYATVVVWYPDPGAGPQPEAGLRRATLLPPHQAHAGPVPAGLRLR
jgi:hypothetical membrane protein